MIRTTGTGLLGAILVLLGFVSSYQDETPYVAAWYAYSALLNGNSPNDDEQDDEQNDDTGSASGQLPADNTTGAMPPDETPPDEETPSVKEPIEEAPPVGELDREHGGFQPEDSDKTQSLPPGALPVPTQLIIPADEYRWHTVLLLGHDERTKQLLRNLQTNVDLFELVLHTEFEIAEAGSPNYEAFTRQLGERFPQVWVFCDDDNPRPSYAVAGEDLPMDADQLVRDIAAAIAETIKRHEEEAQEVRQQSTWRRAPVQQYRRGGLFGLRRIPIRGG